jgi:NAD(P)-dependent dehydrogenase (short-subunit alcohol dehydrogenase family)
MADVAIVIGAGGEIGGACARSLGGPGVVVLCVDRNEEAARETSSRIRSAGGEAEPFVADASDSAFAAAVVTRAMELGPVIAAIHAIAHEEHVEAIAISLESINRSFALGPIAAFSLFRELASRAALASGAGLTVIGSLHATHAFEDALGYNLAHAALAQMVSTLAHEWAGDGIRVNAVVPGWIRTRGEAAFYEDGYLDEAGLKLPMRHFGTPDDIAGAVHYLSSRQAAYVSGCFLTVDGALGASLATLPGASQS